MAKKIWPHFFSTKKESREKIVVATAYDYTSALLLEKAEIPVVLVGDSLANVVAGLANTLSVTIEQMVYHSQMVVRGNKSSLIVTDMPYMSYHVSAEQAVINAGELIRHGGAQAVKVEGGRKVLDGVLPAMARAQIPVVGHLGLTPQSINAMGGYRIQGRETEAQKQLKEDAQFLQEAGCIAIVLEGMPEDLAGEITESLSIATIGIGAGRYTDGQVLVFHDLLGFSEKTPRFVRRYEELGDLALAALRRYKEDVVKGNFPKEGEIY